MTKSAAATQGRCDHRSWPAIPPPLVHHNLQGLIIQDIHTWAADPMLRAKVAGKVVTLAGGHDSTIVEIHAR